MFPKYNVPTPKSIPAKTPAEAYNVARSFGENASLRIPFPTDLVIIGSDKLVIKAQVLAGGRGRGKFDNGFQGGVHMVDR